MDSKYFWQRYKKKFNEMNIDVQIRKLMSFNLFKLKKNLLFV